MNVAPVIEVRTAAAAKVVDDGQVLVEADAERGARVRELASMTPPRRPIIATLGRRR